MRRLFFRGYSVGVMVDGQDIEHFSTTIDEEKNNVRCWIASENEKPFSVCVQNVSHALELDYTFKIFLDGHLAAQPLLSKAQKGERRISSSAVSATEVQDFKFGTLESTDDDAYLEKSTSLRNVGEIKVEVHRVAVLQPDKSDAYASVPESNKVHERTKKALNHQIRFGAKRQLDVPIKRTFVDSLEKLATFTFLYRPLAMLQANGIVPHDSKSETPQPEHSPQTAQKRKSFDRKPESDLEGEEDDEEEEALLERLTSFQSSFQAEMERLRTEIDQVRAKKAAKRSRKRVKAEPGPSYISGEIIDLT